MMGAAVENRESGRHERDAVARASPTRAHNRAALNAHKTAQNRTAFNRTPRRVSPPSDMF